MTNEEVAWLAGLLEGEGCIGFVNKNGVAVTIGMTDRDVIERILVLTGRGAIYEANKRRKKILYQWRVAKKEDATFILKLVLPWMGIRRTERITEALVRLERNKGINRPIQHGTRNGYKSELYRRMDPCRDCKRANSVYQKERVST